MFGKQEANRGAAALRQLVDRVYAEAEAAKEKGEPVGWSSSKFPCELVEAFGLHMVYPENQAAGIAANRDGQFMCEAAEKLGYDNDICAYARISLAYARGIKPERKHPYRQIKMPMPDFLLCCNNICNCMTKWYENIARIHNIPLIMIDIPYRDTIEVEDPYVSYIRGQFDSAIEKLERISGRPFDEARFEKACENANRSAKAWLRICNYLQYKPSPFNGIDLFSYMADIVVARAKPETAETFELLAAELEEAVSKGESRLSFKEDYRILFEGIPCWGNLPQLLKPLKRNGVNVTGLIYAPAFGFVYNNLDEMVKAYCTTPNSVCLEQGVVWRENICRENRVDGILMHFNKGCKPWSGALEEMRRRLQADLRIPIAGFDGDQADPRNFSAAQYETRVQALVEAMENQRS